MNIIIIGAARSGTNMLRDTLVKFDDFATWPCDEINYIWRYGLRSEKDDIFLNSQVTEEKRDYINKKFNWVRNKYNVTNVIEKTCANSLRVDYVNELVEDAKYVFIFRDPIDVVSSAEIRWKAKLDIKYILDKARFIPIKDLPYYASRYFLNRVKKFFNREKRLSYWGPKYRGFEEDAQSLTALEISAVQWMKSVESSEKSFLKMDKSKYIAIDYNEFVESPKEQLEKILEFLGCDIDEQEILESVSKVTNRSIGKGYKVLTEEELEKINSICGNKYEMLKKLFL
jgi:hypothetical protein